MNARTSLRRYTFWYGPCDHEWPDKAVAALKKNEWTEPMYLDGKGWSDDLRKKTATRLLEALGDNQSVTTLILCNATMETDTLQALTTALQKNKSLRYISLRKLNFLDDPLTLPDSVFANRSLKDLSLEKCSLDDHCCQELAQLVRESKSLKSLMLTDLTIEQDKFAQVADAVAESCYSLEKFMLRNIELSETDLASVLEASALNKSITSLTFEKMGLNKACARRVADILSKNSHLQELSLRKNALDGESIKTVMEGVQRNETMKGLFLSHNPIGDDGVEYVVKAMQRNSTLKEMCLSYTEIGEVGGTLLGKGLAHFHGLETLSLDGNNIESVGMQFFHGLQENMVILQIVERMTRFVSGDYAAAWQAVEIFLRFNKNGKRRMLREQGSLPCSLIPTVIASVCKEPDMVYHFVKSLPDMVPKPEMPSVTPTPTRHAQSKDTKLHKKLKQHVKPLSLEGSPQGIIRLAFPIRSGPTKRTTPCA